MATAGVNPSLVGAIANHIRTFGYHQRGDWLNGPCIYPEHHAHGDHKPSFGYNYRTGYGWCFACNRSMTTLEITKRLE